MSIFNYEIEIFENDMWMQLQPWIRPFHDGTTLDESLDFGQIVLAKSPKKEPLKPFTPIRKSIYELPEDSISIDEMTTAQKSIYRVGGIVRLVADTQVEQRGFAYNGGEDWYRHTINTIEYSKLLEREICDNITFTKYLYRDYAVNGKTALESFQLWSGGTSDKKSEVSEEARIYKDFKSLFTLNGGYLSPVKLNSTITLKPATITDANGVVGSVEGDLTTKIIAPNGVEVAAPFQVTQEGTYLIQYIHTGSYQVSTDPAYVYHTAIWQYAISVADFGIPQKENYTIRGVIERILSICTTRREGIEKQKYVLDPVIASKYSEIEAPEFHITRSTLWEALSQVGGYIHAIPRLVYPNVVTFDELGGNEEYFPPVGLKCICYSAGRQVDETCGAIDSTAENFLCTEDLGQGAITEPCAGGWKSIRCAEDGSIISNDTALIQSDFPDYRIIELEVAGFDGARWNPLGVISPYVYENAEYKTLSSYSGNYPFSKAFALRYSQGGKTIEGLSFKQESLNNINEFFKSPAIKNILSQIEKDCPTWYYDLGFRVTYIPMTSARVKQLKPYAPDGKAESNTLLYNQSANTVESASYGENLKGAVARLGNTDEQRTYHFGHYADLPRVGQLWDGKYIARVECEYERQWIKATVTLTENFNRLAQYLGLHTNYRLYDVSEKQSVERQINYGERVIVGDRTNPEQHDSHYPVIKAEGVFQFQKTLEGHGGLIPVGNAVLTGKTKEFEKIGSTIMLPCTSMGLGNSIAFSWRYLDNYGAGYKSIPSGDAGKRVQEIVPYGNVYGELYYLQALLFNGLPTDEPPPDLPHMLPEYPEEKITKHGLFDFDTAPLIVDKDSREQLNITYQLHFVANRRSIVIGSGLGQYNALVSPDPLETELFFSDKRLNVFRPIFPLSEAGRKDFEVTRPLSTCIKLSLPAAPAGTKSWALVGVRRDKDGNVKSKQLIIGENIDGAVQPVYFNFVSNKEV